MSESPKDLDLALLLADAADEISMARFLAADLRVEAKPDLTPVTDADRSVERRLRELIAEHRPDDAVIGEEYGEEHSSAGRRWILDPIDGTKNFVRGVPVWATLIGLYHGTEPLLGVVSAPAMARRWWASSGSGAFTAFADQPPRRCRVSGVRSVADASLSLSELGEWEQIGSLDALLQLVDSCWRMRAYGDFYSYMLVAEGAVDIAAEPQLSIWDVAALIPIVREAGGRFTAVDGVGDPSKGGSALATNGLLHSAAAAILGGSRPDRA